MKNLKPCPFCGGAVKISFKDHLFVGQNAKGDKKIIYRVQVICNKCRSRGKPIITDPLINPNPCVSKWGNIYSENSRLSKENTKIFEPYVNRAIEAWNTRLYSKNTIIMDKNGIFIAAETRKEGIEEHGEP